MFYVRIYEVWLAVQLCCTEIDALPLGRCHLDRRFM